MKDFTCNNGPTADILEKIGRYSFFPVVKMALNLYGSRIQDDTSKIQFGFSVVTQDTKTLVYLNVAKLNQKKGVLN